MPLARLRRALTSSSTQSTQSSSSSQSATSSTLDFSLPSPTTISPSPREISYFDLPLLSRSPTTRNASPRDVFPSSPKEAGFTFTTSALPSPAIETQTFKKEAIKHKRTTSKTSTLLRMLRRERPHPAERLLKPADPVVVCVLDQWGGFEYSQRRSSCGSEWEGVGPLDDI